MVIDRYTKCVLTVIAFSFLLGCASNPGVGKIGDNKYMVSRQAATGFHGLGPLKIEALKEGERYCENMKKSFKLVEAIDSRPPYILGNFPRTEVTFVCQ